MNCLITKLKLSQYAKLMLIFIVFILKIYFIFNYSNSVFEHTHKYKYFQKAKALDPRAISTRGCELPYVAAEN